MEHSRDIQTFNRNNKARATVSGCSSLAMEIKRKKIRESALFECHIQEKIDFEIRMREGALKLLAASSQREQILNASKNVMTSNTRILAYMTDLQRKKESQITNSLMRSGFFSLLLLLDIRIPLMWKDSDHFNSKACCPRVATFCMMKIGSEIFDTEMVVVDKTVTDICFDNLMLFSEAGPNFELTLQLYSCCLEEEPMGVNTPKKLARKLGSSIGKASGRKMCLLLEGRESEDFLQSSIEKSAKYSLLADTTLSLEHAEGSFQSHPLKITEDASFWLPLYGNVCCRLVAQPACMTQDMMSGFLNQQQTIAGVISCSRLYCVLRGGSLFCYYTPEEIAAKVEPALIIPVNKDTRIRAVDKDQKKRTSSFTIINRIAGQAMVNVFVADSREDLQKWMEAFWQHFYDLSQWKHCCEELMKIEIMSPKKPPLFLTKQAASVYHDLSIDSPLKVEGLTDIIHNKIEETNGQFLLKQVKDADLPPWGALFEGTHTMVVQKSILSPSKSCENLSTDATKKRRAPPPPPPNKLVYTTENGESNRLNKENAWKKTEAQVKASSFDSKFSAIMQQFQKPLIPPRKNNQNHRVISGDEQETLENEYTGKLNRPVPAPRLKHKSFKEKINPRSWLPVQD
uniref:Rhotekin 2 n=1 Tax=Erpetoichthys calabaricus TaxID=27687 RepID=A0A8C4X379_ERPCA